MEPKVTNTPLDWEKTLKKAETVCAVTGRVFVPGDEYVSYLHFDSEGGWQRQEVAPEVFEKLENQPFAFWRHKVALPDAKKQRPLDIGFLTEFFKRLQDAGENQDHRELGYIVTLLLVRKKILDQVGLTTEDGQEILEVRFKKEPDSPIHRVLIPEINAEKMEMIRDDLGRIFNLEETAEKDGTAGPLIAEED